MADAAALEMAKAAAAGLRLIELKKSNVVDEPRGECSYLDLPLYADFLSELEYKWFVDVVFDHPGQIPKEEFLQIWPS